MSLRQLNVRVNEEFIKKLETYAKQHRQTLGDVIETFTTPAMEEAEADERFENEAFEAWTEYMNSGECVSMSQIDSRFEQGLKRAAEVAAKKDALCKK